MEPEIVKPAPEDGQVVRSEPRHTRTDGRWSPRTYADELSERDEDPRVRVKCGCGRVRPAFAVVDLRSLPEAVRGDREWACDACKTNLWRGKNRTLASRAEFVRQMGAPEAVIDRIEQSNRGGA